MIPQTSANGVLPPIGPGEKGVSFIRAPYCAYLSEFIKHYSISVERINIIKGFCEYRKCLHEIGITDGFQWINGSFSEDVELLENRPPNDIDVVTFFVLPSGMTQQSLLDLNKQLFCDHDGIKERYRVDAYYVPMDNNDIKRLIRQSTYWYSMWSHRRTGEWKGFIEISLDDATDVSLESLLSSCSIGGVK